MQEPRIPTITQEAIDFANEYFDVPHSTQKLEQMERHLREHQPALAEELFPLIKTVAESLASQFNLSFGAVGAVRHTAMLFLVVSWFALYKQEELDREIIEGDDEGD